MDKNDTNLELLGEIKITVKSDDGKRVVISKNGLKCDEGMSCLITFSSYIDGWEKVDTLASVMSERMQSKLKKQSE